MVPNSMAIYSYHFSKSQFEHDEFHLSLPLDICYITPYLGIRQANAVPTTKVRFTPGNLRLLNKSPLIP
jgi:hypothetical protein